MTNNQITNIISKASFMASAAGVSVTDRHKVFLIKLIEYMENNPGNDTFSASLSLDEMAAELDMPKRTIVSAISSLTAAGVITRAESKTPSKRRGGNPMTTTINKDIFYKS